MGTIVLGIALYTIFRDRTKKWFYPLLGLAIILFLLGV